MRQNGVPNKLLGWQNAFIITDEPGTIPFLTGRPERDTIISNDDIMNLKIALNVCKTLDEFLKIV